jgi:hypothetical protein
LVFHFVLALQKIVPEINSRRYIASLFSGELLSRNFRSFFLDRDCVPRRVALVSIELLLHSRLPELARVGRELRIAGFTDPERRSAADSLQYPKTALCHAPVSHRPANCASITAHARTLGRLGKIEHFHCSDVIASLAHPCQSLNMLRNLSLICILLCMVWGECMAVPKPHVIAFGKWTSAKWPNATGQKLLDLKVRPLFVDTRLKEYTTGSPHELTDRLFVVRRAFRVNDALPSENAGANPTHWQWQRGGWLLVDRVTGRVSQLNLPEFDPFYSTASWYRDYIAYCGVSEDGRKLFAVVAQVGRRKPILKKDAGEPAGDDDPDSECPPPVWERTPIRVTFQPDEDQKLVFSIRSRVVDVVNDTEASEE